MIRAFHVVQCNLNVRVLGGIEVLKVSSLSLLWTMVQTASSTVRRSGLIYWRSGKSGKAPAGIGRLFHKNFDKH
jgi:hypothetical protein